MMPRSDSPAPDALSMPGALITGEFALSDPTPSAPTPSVRARHTFRKIIKARPITPQDLPDYQAQARDVLTAHGSAYLDQWLDGWLDTYTADAAAHAAAHTARQARSDARMALHLPAPAPSHQASA